MAPADPGRLAAWEAELQRLDRVARRESAALVADDMQAMRLLLTQSLRDLGFARVERAADGESAWRILTTKPCDLVLADWNMPRLDGLALLDRVRSHPDHCDLVFILISGERLDRRVMQAAEESQDAYLTKPVSPEKLARRLDLVLQRRRTQAQAGRLAALGRPDDAVDVFLAAAANHPRQRWPYFGLGGLLLDQGRTQDAERCYERVLELDPEALAALVELGRAREAGGQAQAGRALYRQALAMNPRLLKAYDALAGSLAAAGRAGEALDVLRQAMKQQGGNNAGRLEALARLALDQGDHALAESALVSALALKPGHNAAANRAALARARQAQAPAAAPPEPPPAGPAAALDPPEAEDLCRLGLDLVAAGRYEEAGQAYHRGLEIAPRSGRIRFNLAKLRLRQGREEEGLAELTAAVRLGLTRRDWELMVEAARLLDELGRRDQAVALLGQVLRLAPGQADAAALLGALTSPGDA